MDSFAFVVNILEVFLKSKLSLATKKVLLRIKMFTEKNFKNDLKNGVKTHTISTKNFI